MKTVPLSNPLPNAITGDRPTGCLHLGHYIGSLKNRVDLQHTHNLTVLIADTQALTDNARNPQFVQFFILQLMRDYLAAGLDPNCVTFVLQSKVQSLYELTILLMNFTTVSFLERNPTIRQEIVSRNFQRDIPAGFLCYPISQSADIIGLGSGVVPAGIDQQPMIETANMLIDRINGFAPHTLARCSMLLSQTPRLPGTDGSGKMSKSANNTIPLVVTQDQLKKSIHSMYTDPTHLKVSDPGKIEGNTVFSYLDAFDPRQEEVQELKDHYQRGGLGDVVLKKRLFAVLETHLAPIRDRATHTPHDQELIQILKSGSDKAQHTAQTQLEKIKKALNIQDLF